jgi:hypothetical protein
MPEVDSRQYLFAYLIRSLDDVPADFPIPAGDGGFRLGLFLPRDEPDWFGRSSYPTRIALLSGGAIVILHHPKLNEPVIRIPLQELLFVEAGHILLIGWLAQHKREFQQVVEGIARGELKRIEDAVAELQRMPPACTREIPASKDRSMKYSAKSRWSSAISSPICGASDFLGGSICCFPSPWPEP